MGFMCAAVAVDAVDGVLARRLRVREVVPAIDGTLLDNLVDYLNYVVVPAYLLLRAGVFPAGTALAASTAICLSSAYQFSQVDAKADGIFFKGFPSYWNVVAGYLLIAAPPPAVALAVVATLCVMVFVPVYYVYPTRTPVLRSLTIALGLGWGFSMIVMVALHPEVPRWLVGISLLYPSYYVALSLWLTRGRNP